MGASPGRADALKRGTLMRSLKMECEFIPVHGLQSEGRSEFPRPGRILRGSCPRSCRFLEKGGGPFVLWSSPVVEKPAFSFTLRNGPLAEVVRLLSGRPGSLRHLSREFEAKSLTSFLQTESGKMLFCIP
jgi:hypothetical protein